MARRTAKNHPSNIVQPSIFDAVPAPAPIVVEDHTTPPAQARVRERRRPARVEDSGHAPRWGTWPAPEVPLTIAGQPGVWSFRGPFACGGDDFVLLTPFDERETDHPVLRVVPLTDVRAPDAAPRPTPRRRAS